MEFHGLLEEMLDSNNIGFGFNDIEFDQNALLATPTTFLDSSPLSITSQTTSCSNFEDFSLPFVFDPQTLNGSSFDQHDFIHPFVDQHLLSAHPEIKLEYSPLYDQDYHSMFSMLDDVQNYTHFVHDHVSNQLDPQGRVLTGGEPEPERPTAGFNMGKNGSKLERQPSKNLMAERRRRKRLNDRLSMLRSVVPKISKMDRTSILADTIEYMKELIEKIKHMQQQMDMEMDIVSPDQPKQLFIRNSPKFEVERRSRDTRISVCCSGKPELLISTISTLEALGLQIQECVISCFNDFTMHASCDHHLQEMEEQGLILTSDDIKQALFRNAGYGGKCL